MTRFIITRLVLLAAGLLVASALIFFALRVLPGDVAQVIAGTTGTPDQVAAIRHDLGLDRPLIVQYLEWIGGIVHGDFGHSLITGTPVTDELAQKAQVTVPLTVFALIVALIVAVPLGVVSAAKHDRFAGGAITLSAQTIAAVPVVWAGMVLVIVFAVALHWLPAQGFPLDGWHDPGAALRSLVLPAVAIGTVEGAVLLRFVRSATLEVSQQDFLRAAAAKGMTSTRALVRHGLPNVAVSIVSVLSIQIAGLLVGAVIVEQLFNLPGIGRMLVSDTGVRDLTKVQGEVFVLTAAVLVLGTVVDVAHRLIDPRLREGIR